MEMIQHSEGISNQALLGKNVHCEADITTWFSDNNSGCDQRTAVVNVPDQCNGNINVEPMRADFTSKNSCCCDTCGGTFSCSKSLSDHQSDCIGKSQGDSRNKRKQFSCEVCNKAFQYRSDLLHHYTVHTNEKPFICNTCGKMFKRNSHLRRHLLIHTGERLFNCSFCSKSFSRDDHLKCHLVIHTGVNPVVCSFCSKKFLWESDLKLHLLIHSGEKTFNCCFCARKFVRVNRLKTHMLIHTGEKPHSCDICEKHYRRKCDLARHLKTHSEDTLKCNGTTKPVDAKSNPENENSGGRYERNSFDEFSFQSYKSKTMCSNEIIVADDEANLCNDNIYECPCESDVNLFFNKTGVLDHSNQDIREALDQESSHQDIPNITHRTSNEASIADSHLSHASDISEEGCCDTLLASRYIIPHSIEKVKPTMSCESLLDTVQQNNNMNLADNNVDCNYNVDKRDTVNNPLSHEKTVATSAPEWYNDDIKVEPEVSNFAFCRENTSEKLGVCTKCGKSFNWSTGFSDPQNDCKCHHMSMKSFDTTSELKTDNGSYYSEKKFSCDVCGKAFQSGSKLVRHIAVHTSDRPFDCDFCGMKFKRSSHLQRHVLIHTGEKPFNCNICDKNFLRSHDLKSHCLTHTGEKPFTCNICGKKSSTAGDQKKHILIHTGEKQFTCNVCGKNFSLACNLKRHQSIHTSVKTSTGDPI